MTVFTGSCHCGNIAVRFETDQPVDEVAVRACACSFCRAHGASTVSDPHGTLTVRIEDPGAARRYRFGLKTADFLLCAGCGVYVAAVLPDPAGAVAIVNANTFRTGPPRGDRGTAVSYDGETEAARAGTGAGPTGRRSPSSKGQPHDTRTRAKIEMTAEATVLIIGTVDTKADELLFMKGCIEDQGGRALLMDVGVLGDPPFLPDISKHDVAAAADTTIEAIIALGDENDAMTKMAEGAAALTARYHQADEIDGMIALGGTMGTDLALDAASALPMGVPKLVVSTVSFSPLIPAERLPADLMMILWAGGLYGLNSICRASLAQAAGAVLGARRAAQPPQSGPARGRNDVAGQVVPFLHGVPDAGAGGTRLRGRHLPHHRHGRTGFRVAGRPGQVRGRHGFQPAGSCQPPERLRRQRRGKPAGRRAPPAFPRSWRPARPTWWTCRPGPACPRIRRARLPRAQPADRIGDPDPDDRRRTARVIGEKLAGAKGKTAFRRRLKGIEEWDQSGEDLHDPEGLAAFIDECRTAIAPRGASSNATRHINDAAFVETALAIFRRLDPGRDHTDQRLSHPVASETRSIRGSTSSIYQ